MAKKINVKGAYYKVSADVVILDSEGSVSIEHITDTNFISSVRANKKHISETAEKYFDGSKCINVVNLNIERVTYTDEYIIKDTNAAIINACIAYGLDVVAIDSDDNETPVEIVA